MRDLGELGENTLRMWCSAIGAACNKSSPDKFGWDFLVEFPIQAQGTIPRDMMNSPIECKIQVKATDQNKKSVAIKISALERLVKDSRPAFILFLEFDKQDRPQAAYLVHIDPEICKNVLRSIRLLHIDGETHRLNKHTLTINYNESNKIDLSGEDLNNAVAGFVVSMDDYSKQKINSNRSIGFENGVGEASISFPNESLEQLFQAQLGLTQLPIKAKDFQFFFTRFDLKDNEPFSSFFDGELSLTPVGTLSEIIFVHLPTGETFSFSGELFSATLLAKKGIRFHCNLFEINLTFDNSETFKFKFNFNFSNPILSKDIESSIKFYDRMTEMDSTWELTIDGAVISNEDNPLKLPNDNLSTLPKELSSSVLFVLKKLKSHSNLELSFGDLINHHNVILTICSFLKEDSSSIELELHPSEDTPDIFCGVALTHGHIGNKLVAIFCSFIAEQSVNDHTPQTPVYTVKNKIIECVICGENNEISPEVIKETYNSLIHDKQSHYESVRYFQPPSFNEISKSPS